MLCTRAAATLAACLAPAWCAGDALVYGESISSTGGMDAVRPLMGVCPQFDVLLAQLTGREHLLLFGAIKGESPQLP